MRPFSPPPVGADAARGGPHVDVCTIFPAFRPACPCTSLRTSDRCHWCGNPFSPAGLQTVPCALRPPSSFRLAEKKMVRARARRKGRFHAGFLLTIVEPVPADIRPFPKTGCNRGIVCRLCFRAETLRLAAVRFCTSFPPLPGESNGGPRAPLAVSIREGQGRGRNRNLPLPCGVSFVTFLWAEPKKSESRRSNLASTARENGLPRRFAPRNDGRAFRDPAPLRRYPSTSATMSCHGARCSVSPSASSVSRLFSSSFFSGAGRRMSCGSP